MIVFREPRNPDDLQHIPMPPAQTAPETDETSDVESRLKSRIAAIKTACDQEIEEKATRQEQDSARNRIVLAMARKQPAPKADIELLDWVEARLLQCEADVQHAIGE